MLARRLLELIRFSHTALRAAVRAAGGGARVGRTSRSAGRISLGILLCMVFARIAAMAFNRLADRHIDAQNPRTAARHLPAGTLSVAACVAFTLACCAGFVASTLLFYFREPAEPVAAVPVRAGAAVRARLLAREAVHEPGALLARRGAGARADRRVDRGEGAGRHDRAAAARRGGGVLGGRVRHPVCVPGRGVRQAEKGCTACRRDSACGRVCGSRLRATR